MNDKILVRPAASMMGIDQAMEQSVELENNYDTIMDYIKKEFYYWKPKRRNITVKYHC